MKVSNEDDLCSGKFSEETPEFSYKKIALFNLRKGEFIYENILIQVCHALGYFPSAILLFLK